MSDGPAPRGFDPADLSPPSPRDGTATVTSIALDVAGACNLACRYCAEAATQPTRRPMSDDTLEAAWRLLAPAGRPRRGSIRLGSGEPLLALPLLRKLVDMVERDGGSFTEGRPAVFLTTNGTLARPEVRDWLVSTGWNVKLSLDGPPAVHDRWRVTRQGAGTWDLVAEAVADLATRIPERFSVTAVLCRGAEPAMVFAAIERLGVRRIELVPVVHEDETVLPGTEDVERYAQFVESYARRLAASPTGAAPSLVRFETCVRRVMGYDLQRVPCAAGRSFMGVGPDGDLYPCFRFFGVDGYRLGHVATGPDQEAVAEFQRGAGRGYEKRRACQDCWAAPLCGGPCFACAEMFGPGGGEPVSLHCDYLRADARQAVWLVERLRADDPERLLAFHPGYAEAFAGLA